MVREGTTQRGESYELEESDSRRTYDDFLDRSSFDDPGAAAQLLNEAEASYPVQPTLQQRLRRLIPFTQARQRTSPPLSHSQRRKRLSSSSTYRRLLFISVGTILALLVVTAIFFPSYTSPPARYAELRQRAQRNKEPGSGNIQKQKIFIAASIFDKHGDLAGGKWGQNVLDLIHLLGPEQTYLSIYENDAGPTAAAALKALEEKIACESTLRFDEHLSFDEVGYIALPDGTSRVKRITYLSEARNRALIPLESSVRRFDKVLYINDVVFDPVEVAQLLFLTGASESGETTYRAACSVDFINPIKYYDTFATRDYEGYGIGLPFYPWYTTAGSGTSRRDVLAGSDAVRVRSCWGGIVAFDAKFLQPQADSATLPTTAASTASGNLTAPYRFRAEEDLFWDASECCLIHADIQDPDPTHSGIYMNPYVRVAYDWRTLTWLSFSRRFVKLYLPFHMLNSKTVGMPWYNPRRAEVPGEIVEDRVWVAGPSPGFRKVKRPASHSGFCGRRGLQVMKEDTSGGGKPWEFLPVPP